MLLDWLDRGEKLQFTAQFAAKQCSIHLQSFLLHYPTYIDLFISCQVIWLNYGCDNGILQAGPLVSSYPLTGKVIFYSYIYLL